MVRLLAPRFELQATLKAIEIFYPVGAGLVRSVLRPRRGRPEGFRMLSSLHEALHMLGCLVLAAGRGLCICEHPVRGPGQAVFQRSPAVT